MKRIVRIGITGGPGGRLPRGPERYLQSVGLAGGTAEFIGSGEGLRLLADRFDGFIIPGGQDLHPSRYGEEVLCPFEPEEEERVDFELSLLHEMVRLQKPVLGICYGMQLLNVYFGGTLYQDIDCQIPGSQDHRGGVHVVTVSGNPYISEGVYEVQSSHHQALKEPGRGVRVFARAGDRIIEAWYHESYRFIVGVQFHAERMNTVISGQLFRAFLGACHG